MSTAAGPPESDSRKVSNSRVDSNIQQGGHQQQQQELATTTSAISRRQQQKRDPQQEMPEIVEMPTTLLASAGTPTVQ
jgi:hypothetical protein